MANIARFSVLYTLGLLASSIDLTVTVRNGHSLTGTSFGGTSAYALMGCGIVFAAKFGMRLIAVYGPRRMFTIAGLLAAGLCQLRDDRWLAGLVLRDDRAAQPQSRQQSNARVHDDPVLIHHHQHWALKQT